MVGYYSRKSAQMSGSDVYLMMDGREMEITNVANTKEDVDKIRNDLPDLEFVGEVDKYLYSQLTVCW
jgi:hypothetical protein